MRVASLKGRRLPKGESAGKRRNAQGRRRDRGAVVGGCDAAAAGRAGCGAGAAERAEG